MPGRSQVRERANRPRHCGSSPPSSVKLRGGGQGGTTPPLKMEHGASPPSPDHCDFVPAVRVTSGAKASRTAVALRAESAYSSPDGIRTQS